MRLSGGSGRTHDPLAMQKVVGSNPIIRFFFKSSTFSSKE
jgi:hypothetical protein